MTMKTRLFTLFAALCVMAVAAFAQNAGEIRHRMEQRLPQIDALKAQEIVGENNRGLLEERKPGGGSIIAEENHDREAVYALIARETGATADSVGRARAKQIATSSRAGVWVQDESGAWIHHMEYRNRHSEFGWEIANCSFGVRGHGIEALRPMQWQNYVDFMVAARSGAAVTADGLRNVRRLL